MARLIDTSLWIDFTRPRTRASLRDQIRPILDATDACQCEPIRFEILRAATPDERRGLNRRFAAMPALDSPSDLWERAIRLGQRCRDAGNTPGALDLLIAAIALEHDAEVVSFDGDYSLIAQAEPRLRVQLLARAA